MRVNLGEEVQKRTSLAWIVTAAIGDRFEELFGPRGGDRKSITDAELIFTINGKEIDVSKLFDRIIEEMHHQAKAAGLEAVMAEVEALREAREPFDNAVRSLEREVVHKMRAKLQLPPDDDYR